MGRLIIDGNSVYEVDEECLLEKEVKRREMQKKEIIEEILNDNTTNYKEHFYK